mmetsp:Transcript_5286/g.10103  ORF Transcript_5286/g.10103 Transcript_5286/m.10103 type:complete len:358 (-) Transcript_5286:33-1106(-)|eukprot:CAMPEP_0175107114 /NCGR_PEP_ID=MMETSP0086_2-20121207/11674_1 /TAXON_ID=136419 /ORGANISM="Unknown Unknown, Strain D1" /LENGTH=357 /DNA_ID=CAMNT_0016383723 /DNA_START=41 /DNA_END=1114 /DNA_ORIENTATION=+
MDGSANPQIIEHISHSVDYSPFDVKWVPSSARFVSLGCHAKGTGAFQVFAMDDGKLNKIAETTKTEGIKCGTFGASLYEERHLATGDYKGRLNIWDLEKPEKPLFDCQGHSSMINCIDGIGGLNIGGGAPELVTGGHDGCVKVWDPRISEPVASLEPAPGQTKRDCWAVTFGNSYDDEERCVCAGYDNGDIKLLDLRMNKIRWETNIKNGIVGLQFDRKDIKMNKLVATSLESSFYLFDMRTMHPEEGYAYMTVKAHKSTVWHARHTPQNRDVFMTTGGNGTLNLYKYNYPSQRAIKDSTTGEARGVMGTANLLNSRKFSDQPIVAYDWHPDKNGLAVMACLDQTVKVGIVTKLNKV